MAFSLSNWFKGKPGAPGSENPDETASAAPTGAAPAAVAAAPVATPAPPPAVRKVVPNSVQPVSLRTPGAPRPATLPVSTPTGPAAAPAASAPRPKISFADSPTGGEAAAPAAEPPPELGDAMVALEVGDFYDRLPPGLLQGGSPVDRRRTVEFRASELYSDLTKGRASVPASVIYQKCPELFSRPVTETEDTEVSLPLQKLVEQMSQAFQTRADQVAEENVGEIETPFLQVALEDNARLPKAAGTTAGAIRGTASPLNEPPFRPHRTGQISTISPLKMPAEPPPMQAAPSAATVTPINPALKRPPSTVRASVAGGKIRLSGPSMPNRMVPVNPASVHPPAPAAVPVNEAAPTPPSVSPVELPPSASQRILPPLQVPGAPTASPSHQVSKKTARIQIPPISLKGAGAGSRPAAPSAVSVQPSPVPVRPAPSAEPAVPPIAFRSSPPPPGTKKMPHSFAPPPPRPAVPPAFPASPVMPAFPAPPVAPPADAAPAAPALPSGFPAATDDRKISLSLAAVLRGLPLSALALEPHHVPDEVRVTLPFSLVEGQLAQGRVSVPMAVFAGSLPEGYREALATNSGLSEVPLPLQEVFQNLPPAALSMRQDQVTEEISHIYPTPFAQKAEEDAERLGTGAVKDSAPAAPAPEIAMDRPLPPDPVAEEPAPEPEAAAPAPEPVAEKEEEAAPSEEFANLFVEEPPAPARDIPLDLGGDKPADKEEPAPVAPVEAKAPVEEKPPVEDKAPEPPKPEPVAEAKPSEPVADEAKPEPPVEAKAEPAPAPGPEVRAEEKPFEGVLPAPASEEKPTPAAEEKRAEPAPEPVAAKAPEAPAREEKPEPAKPEPAPAASTNGQHAAHVEEKPAAPVRQTAPATVQDSVLQGLFMTEDELDAKGVVRHVCTLPGIEGCAVMFEDGLQLAGNFPSEADAEGFSAMAPPFFKRTRNFAGETKLGALRAFTLHTGKRHVQLLHARAHLPERAPRGPGFLPGVREKLETVTRELARMYATDAQAH